MKVINLILRYLLKNWKPITAFLVREIINRALTPKKPKPVEPIPEPAPKPELKEKFAAAAKKGKSRWQRSYNKRRFKRRVPEHAFKHIFRPGW